MRTIEETQVVSSEDRALLGAVKSLILRFLPDAEAFLYGSAARGTRGPDSDYDVLVLTETPIATQEEDRVRDTIYDLQVAEGKLISTFFFTRQFWEEHPDMPFHREVDRDAILL